MTNRPARSLSIWMPRTIRCTAIRKAAFSTDTIDATAICRSISSAAVTFWRPRSNIDASKGAEQEVERIITQIRSTWPKVRIILRADSGFARNTLMGWCEANKVDDIFGLARNERLENKIAPALQDACLA